MPKSKGTDKAGSPKSGQNPRSASSKRFEQVSNSTSQIVKDAAALLDEELAAGIVAANQVQKRFRKEGRVEPADFNNALQRFRTDAHEVITLLNDRLNDARSDQNFEVVKNLVNRSHDMVDLAVEMVNSSAEVATQLANSPIVKKNLGSRAGRKR
jgi:NADH:ubiquinone oxidoreductase subunit C